MELLGVNQLLLLCVFYLSGVKHRNLTVENGKELNVTSTPNINVRVKFLVCEVTFLRITTNEHSFLIIIILWHVV